MPVSKNLLKIALSLLRMTLDMLAVLDDASSRETSVAAPTLFSFARLACHSSLDSKLQDA